MSVFFWEPTPRQLQIMGFLAVMGPCDEGDVALAFPVMPEELSRVPDSFMDTPGDYIARVELETLRQAGMVFHDGVLWGLSPRGQKLWLLKGQAPRG
ncbi:MAG: hypothetical protein ACOYU7_05505 [Bacillota bacterium]